MSTRLQVRLAASRFSHAFPLRFDLLPVALGERAALGPRGLGVELTRCDGLGREHPVSAADVAGVIGAGSGDVPP